jgi:hypothetical protein
MWFSFLFLVQVRIQAKTAKWFMAMLVTVFPEQSLWTR